MNKNKNKKNKQTRMKEKSYQFTSNTRNLLSF